MERKINGRDNQGDGLKQLWAQADPNRRARPRYKGTRTGAQTAVIDRHTKSYRLVKSEPKYFLQT